MLHTHAIAARNLFIITQVNTDIQPLFYVLMDRTMTAIQAYTAMYTRYVECCIEFPTLLYLAT